MEDGTRMKRLKKEEQEGTKKSGEKQYVRMITHCKGKEVAVYTKLAGWRLVKARKGKSNEKERVRKEKKKERKLS